MAHCKACNGSYKHHGLVGKEGCICGTKDAWRECRDGLDCEGTCLFERVEIVKPPELGVLVGRCTALKATFGCYEYIPAGASKLSPRLLPRPERVCVD